MDAGIVVDVLTPETELAMTVVAGASDSSRSSLSSGGMPTTSLGPIAAVVLWMGVYPESFLAPIRDDVGVLLERIERANPPGDAQLAMGAGMPAEADHGDGHAAEGAH